MSPYKAVLGLESYVGMERLNLPTEQQNKIQTAKQLYSVLASLNENDDLKKGYLATCDEDIHKALDKKGVETKDLVKLSLREAVKLLSVGCLLYTSPSPRD